MDNRENATYKYIILAVAFMVTVVVTFISMNYETSAISTMTMTQATLPVVMMQTEEGQINESYSISAGLDFPSVGPEHAYLKDIGRVSYVAATDLEALEAFMTLSMEEGIIPALESSHALAYALKLVRENPEKEQTLLVNLSGRGDKDIFQVSAYLEKAGFMKEGRIVPGMLEALRTRIAAAK